MNNMRFYMSFLIAALLLGGCSKSNPKPKEIVEAKVEIETIQTVELEPKIVKKTDFMPQNYVAEDKYTRVFKNCFKTGKVSLNKTCKKKLQKLLQETPLIHKREVIIEVHTDLGGTNKKNQEISQKRAYSAASSLYYKDYKHSKVYYSGFGEEEPLYNTRSKKADIENRRLVVKVREKNYKVDKKVFKRYVHKSKTKKTKATVSLKKETSKPTGVAQKPLKAVAAPTAMKTTIPVNILRYTGKADTGWMYFGPSKLKEKFLVSCVDDKPRKVRRKAISKSKKGEFMSGFYSKRITGDFGKNYVEIYPVYLYENGSLPKSNPIVTIYGDDRKVQRLQTTVNSYRGKKGILYRIFVNGKKSVECMDLVIPYGTKRVSYGRVYSEENGKIRETKFIAE